MIVVWIPIIIRQTQVPEKCQFLRRPWIGSKQRAFAVFVEALRKDRICDCDLRGVSVGTDVLVRCPGNRHVVDVHPLAILDDQPVNVFDSVWELRPDANMSHDNVIRSLDSQQRIFSLFVGPLNRQDYAAAGGRLPEDGD